MYEYFKKALDEKNMKVSDFSRLSGIGQSTFSDWKSGRSTPKADKMQRIAECLGVSVEYLLTGKDSSEYVMPNFDPREHEIIEKFGSLDEDEKNMALNLFNLFKPKESKERKKELISIMIQNEGQGILSGTNYYIELLDKNTDLENEDREWESTDDMGNYYFSISKDVLDDLYMYLNEVKQFTSFLIEKNKQ